MKQRLKEVVIRIGRDIWQYKEVLLLFAAYYIMMHKVFHAFCPLVMLTGFPCAGCGMTRAVVFMLTGQFARSFRLHPMALPVILFGIYCIGYRYLLGKRVRGFKAGIAFLALGMLAFYLYGMCTVFPDRTPYVYTGGNFLERHIPVYRDVLRSLLGI